MLSKDTEETLAAPTNTQPTHKKT